MRSFIVLCLLTSAAAAQEPWTTYRGNARRTGNTDNKPGPAKPNVLWFMKSKDQFLTSPVPVGNRLLVSGLGALNTAYFACLDTDPKPAKRVLWNPDLTQPTVSSPGIMAGKLIFGDGMHQNNGANLHCLSVDTGKRVWQFPVPGQLVHIEGSPVISGVQGLCRGRLRGRPGCRCRPARPRRQGAGPGCDQQDPRNEVGRAAGQVQEGQGGQPEGSVPQGAQS